MVEFDKVPGMMSMSIPDPVVYVIFLIMALLLGVIVWQVIKVMQEKAKKEEAKKKKAEQKRTGSGKGSRKDK